MLNTSIHYHNETLYCDEVPVADIAHDAGTPVYIYSLKRAVENLGHIRDAFSGLNAHIHYSAKANANLAVLRAVIGAGAGIDVVSAGEIHRALMAGANSQDIVFAGVGKTREEIRYAIEQNVGWFNVENVDECRIINDTAAQAGKTGIRAALRLNPDVTADTHPYIATGHGGAKFGLTAETVAHLLANRSDYPNLAFSGIHIHIGSQLHDTAATRQAVQKALDLIAPHPDIRTVNIGGGLPVAYQEGSTVPDFQAFAAILGPLLQDYTVLLEPGRSVIADAGILVARVLYMKRQAGQTMIITDGSMAELIRPALYQAHHEIVPVVRQEGVADMVQVVGPVCETADILGRDVALPELQSGDLLAVLTAGAYGMVMASNYNARLRPPEVVVDEDGKDWHIARHRETWDDLLRNEV